MKDPAILFYTQDFIVGTMTMTNEQVGKYIRLLCLQHQKNGQLLSERDMLYICETYDEDVFNKFTKNDDGLYYNERLKDEAERRKRYSESRANNRKPQQTYKVKRYSNICLSCDNHMETETNILCNTCYSKSNYKKEGKTTHADFYKKQLELSGDDPGYKSFIMFLYGKSEHNDTKCDNILAIKEQLTYKQFILIQNLYKSCNLDKSLREIVLSMQNHKDIRKKQSLNLTLQNWLRNEAKWQK